MAKGGVVWGGTWMRRRRRQTALLRPPVPGRKTTRGANSSAWGRTAPHGLTHTCGEGVRVGQSQPAARRGGDGDGVGASLLRAAPSAQPGLYKQHVL